MELVDPEISVQLDFISDDKSMADCDVNLSMFSRDIRMIFMSEMSEMLCWSLLISSLFFWIRHLDSSSSTEERDVSLSRIKHTTGSPSTEETDDFLWRIRHFGFSGSTGSTEEKRFALQL
jgi:hypothetical protein